MPELIELEVRERRPRLAGTGTGRIAICETPGSVHAYDLDGVTVAAVATNRVHYSKYSRPDDQDSTVHGLVGPPSPNSNLTTLDDVRVHARSRPG